MPFVSIPHIAARCDQPFVVYSLDAARTALVSAFMTTGVESDKPTTPLATTAVLAL